MKEILIFAGTTEGRKLSEILAEAGILHTICVATEYGEIVLKDHPMVKVHQGRMNREEIREFIQKGKFLAVVDTTHPYADIVTNNIKEVMQGMDIPYFRLNREDIITIDRTDVFYFDSNEACAEALQKTEGNILLTTGSKELAKYCVSEEVKGRLYVRVLPSVESIQLCMKQGICGKQILAMQGPFSAEMNEVIIRQYHISCLVTKESGTSGGYQEKLESARKVGCQVFVVGRPKEEEGFSFQELCKELGKICGLTLKTDCQMEVVLAGIGMGSHKGMTKEVLDAIEHADILLGAKRMLEGFEGKKEQYPYYLSSQIIPYLKELQEKNTFLDKKRVVVLFSGDTGFNSGCKALHHALMEERKKGILNISVRILPGISSVAYLASCLGESYEDADICSIHGKEFCNLAHRIAENSKTFLLMSGVKDVNRLGELLLEAGLDACEVVVGYQLSYPKEQIFKVTPKECCTLEKEGLYICLIRNDRPLGGRITHGMADGDFIREKVPMTKEEVREVSICKLKLHKKSIVYDFGSGTGSIAVEIANLSDDIQVYAIEQKQEAVFLIEQNRKKYMLENIHVIRTKAPKGLDELPKPTHAFIGGSGGELKEILSVLYQKNPRMRIVINAISMETICEIKEVLVQFTIEDVDVVQLQVSRAKRVGNYHLMQGENPVWICSFQFCD